VSRKKKKNSPQPPAPIPPAAQPAEASTADFRPPLAGASPHFVAGLPVRVKDGVRDPDFPDLDLGGWTATILDVNDESDPPTYELGWTDETRRRIDPVWRQRCEQEGLDFDTIWLAANDFEPDPTRPFEAPAAPRAAPADRRPAALLEQERRIRAALGVPVDREIPVVDRASLQTYYAHLKARLPFPLPCLEHAENGGAQAERVTLVNMSAFSEDARFGLVAEIRRGESADFVPLWTLSVDQPADARQLVEDYAFWFWSQHPARDGGETGSLLSPGSGNPVWYALKTATAYGAGFGATTGALLATDDKAFYGMYVGAPVLALAGATAGVRFGRVFGMLNGMRFGHLYGALFGVMAGALIGTALGVMVMGAVGTISGSILGSLLGAGFAQLKWEPIRRGYWAPLGACIGGIAWAMWNDRAQAFTGAIIGAATGALLVLLLVMLLLVTVGLTSRIPR
jgi:hypothetical protein